MVHQFVKCATRILRFAPTSDRGEINPPGLPTTDERGLVEVRPGLPMDVASEPLRPVRSWEESGANHPPAGFTPGAVP